MLIRRCGPAVIVHAPAKVNLFLEVLGRRPDGYHDLATLMVAVSLYDTLEIQQGPDDQVRLDGDEPTLSNGRDNLIVRAAELLKRKTAYPGGCRIRLRKRIPMAAGLAGGSSDAAAALAGLNVVWRLGLSKAELVALGAEIGSDVAFFFSTPAAWCTGRGERVEPLSMSRPLDLVLARPREGLSTARVFGALQLPEHPIEGHELREAFRAGDIEDLGKRLHNRLQSAAEGLCPAVSELCRRLAEHRPAGVMMSGSGSTVFALCRDAAEAGRIARAMRLGMDDESGPRVWIVRGCV